MKNWHMQFAELNHKTKENWTNPFLKIESLDIQVKKKWKNMMHGLLGWSLQSIQHKEQSL